MSRSFSLVFSVALVSETVVGWVAFCLLSFFSSCLLFYEIYCPSVSVKAAARTADSSDVKHSGSRRKTQKTAVSRSANDTAAFPTFTIFPCFLKKSPAL